MLGKFFYSHSVEYFFFWLQQLHVFGLSLNCCAVGTESYVSRLSLSLSHIIVYLYICCRGIFGCKSSTKKNPRRSELNESKNSPHLHSQCDLACMRHRNSQGSTMREENGRERCCLTMALAKILTTQRLTTHCKQGKQHKEKDEAVFFYRLRLPKDKTKLNIIR